MERFVACVLLLLLLEAVDRRRLGYADPADSGVGDTSMLIKGSATAAWAGEPEIHKSIKKVSIINGLKTVFYMSSLIFNKI